MGANDIGNKSLHLWRLCINLIIHLSAQAAVFDCVQTATRGHMSARWELWMCTRTHGWVCMCICASAMLSILFHGSFAAVLVTAGCPVSSNLSCFTVQAVVELLSLCGLSVVSGLLTQNLLKCFFSSSVSCFKRTYTQAQTSKHKPTCGHECIHVTCGMWRNLVLWWVH